MGVHPGQVPPAEPGQGSEGGVLIGGEVAEGHILVGDPGTPPGGDGAHAVAEEPELEHGGREEGGVPPLLVLEPWEGPDEVDLVVDEVGDEPAEVLLGESLLEVRRQEQGLAGIVPTEVTSREIWHAPRRARSLWSGCEER